MAGLAFRSFRRRADAWGWCDMNIDPSDAASEGVSPQTRDVDAGGRGAPSASVAPVSPARQRETTHVR